jgi:hypothetical protein
MQYQPNDCCKAPQCVCLTSALLENPFKAFATMIEQHQCLNQLFLASLPLRNQPLPLPTSVPASSSCYRQPSRASQQWQSASCQAEPPHSSGDQRAALSQPAHITTAAAAAAAAMVFHFYPRGYVEGKDDYLIYMGRCGARLLV